MSEEINKRKVEDMMIAMMKDLKDRSKEVVAEVEEVDVDVILKAMGIKTQRLPELMRKEAPMLTATNNEEVEVEVTDMVVLTDKMELDKAIEVEEKKDMEEAAKELVKKLLLNKKEDKKMKMMTFKKKRK